MKFTSTGPTLPDDLLVAHDAGEVLFFCGAGVSRAKAVLPNFAKLADKVMASLGSAQASPARRLLKASREFQSASGLSGLVATDRIFGMLEREFEKDEVRRSVAEFLSPSADLDLSAHRILIDLSRTRGGLVRLITTNFDRLFEECDSALHSFNPPNLPDPRRHLDFKGVIHLHGCVDSTYRFACDNELILSSADFGHAYLADGWAARYIQLLIEKYRIVFVGYSAEDPPMQYLLEALNNSAKSKNKIYAFQSSEQTWAADQWTQKGVQPILYNSDNHHSELWETLSLWAERSRDVEGWRSKLISVAATAGPNGLEPFQRGQIAHILSTFEGANHIYREQPSLSAIWLNVVDPLMRYGEVEKLDPYDKNSSPFDPFYCYGLESDEQPPVSDPDQLVNRREVPAEAWNGFEPSIFDADHASVKTLGGIANSKKSTPLPPRLQQLAGWFARISHEPASLWWAVHQNSLHPQIQDRLMWSLDHEKARYSSDMRRVWRLLLAYWQEGGTTNSSAIGYRLIQIASRANADGWSASLVSEAVNLYRPFITVKGAFRAASKIGLATSPLEFIAIDVAYPHPHEAISFPADHLSRAVELFRANLDLAILLEQEVSGHERIFLDTLRGDNEKTLSESTYGITGHLISFTRLVSELLKVDRSAAREECKRWKLNSNDIYTQLILWAVSQNEIFSSSEAAQIFLTISSERFWTHRHERDLLFALRDRWNDLNSESVSKIEDRLLSEIVPWLLSEGESERLELQAHCRLSRLHWLHTQGVKFSFDYSQEVLRLRELAPSWRTEYGDQIAQPVVGDVYSINNDTSSQSIDELPLNEILQASHELEVRDIRARVERNPFEGLVSKKPARALGAITDAARRGYFDSKAWYTYLFATSTRDCSARSLRVTAHRLSKLKESELSQIIYPASEWLLQKSKALLLCDSSSFDVVWNALTGALSAQHGNELSSREKQSWVDAALNQPAGKMAQAIFNDPFNSNTKAGVGLPESWRKRMERLLSLPADHRRQSISIFSSKSRWLFNIDPEWMKTNIVKLAEGQDQDGKAFWEGFLWQSKPPQLSLFWEIKKSLLAQTKLGPRRQGHSAVLAGMVLHGWRQSLVGDMPIVGNDEFREVLINSDEEFRIQVLWHLRRWSEEHEDWKELIIPFLTKAWPRQRSIRTGIISGQLVELALCHPGLFAKVTPIILPILGRAVASFGLFSLDHAGANEVIKESPKLLLELLWILFGEGSTQWPIDTDEVLNSLKVSEETKNDPKLSELVRRRRLSAG